MVDYHPSAVALDAIVTTPGPLRTSPTIAALALALSKASATFGPLKKDHLAQIQTRGGSSFSYSYATLPSVIEATRAALAANGLAVLQALTVRNQFVVVETRLLHESGEWVSAELALAIADTLDPRQIGSASTYARRFALCALLNVAGDDDDDAAAASPSTPKPKRNAAPAPRSEEHAPAAADALTDAMRKKMFALARQAGWTDEQLRKMLKDKFGVLSSKQLKRDDFEELLRVLARGPGRPPAPAVEPPG